MREKQREFIYKDILKTYRNKLKNKKNIDYNDIYILVLNRYFDEEYIKNNIFKEYKYIIIDECQDLKKYQLLYFLKIKETLKENLKLILFYDDA